MKLRLQSRFKTSWVSKNLHALSVLVSFLTLNWPDLTGARISFAFNALKAGKIEAIEIVRIARSPSDKLLKASLITQEKLTLLKRLRTKCDKISSISKRKTWIRLNRRLMKSSSCL